MPCFEGLQIHAISDTHNKHKHFTLPGGDILIHSGDACSRGDVAEMMAFLEWFGDQDYSHLIYIPGNHDWLAERNPELVRDTCKRLGITLLIDEGVEIEGIKIWGSPVQPWFYDWAFNRQRGEDIKRHWDMIPADTEILITHGPPYQILDFVPERWGGFREVGCADLRAHIDQSKIKLHIFGHIHYAAGYRYLDGRTFVNAAALSESYMPTRGHPIIIVKQLDDYFVENRHTEREQNSEDEEYK